MYAANTAKRCVLSYIATRIPASCGRGCREGKQIWPQRPATPPRQTNETLLMPNLQRALPPDQPLSLDPGDPPFSRSHHETLATPVMV